MAYETLSETEFGLNDIKSNANDFVINDDFLEGKLEALQVHPSELADAPFPRNL